MNAMNAKSKLLHFRILTDVKYNVFLPIDYLTSSNRGGVIGFYVVPHTEELGASLSKNH